MSTPEHSGARSLLMMGSIERDRKLDAAMEKRKNRRQGVMDETDCSHWPTMQN
jgi:hypothetical protein